MKPISAQQAWQVLQNADCLYKAEEVEAALESIAARATQALADKNPVVVCIMRGAIVPMGKLLLKLQFPLQIDYVHVTRYRDKLQGGHLEWIAGPYVDVRDRTVLLVDDILDEGATLAAIEQRFREDGAAEVYKTVLIVKDRSRTHAITVDFPGLEVPDRYVFGYGMDYKGYLRNAPGIYAERVRP